MSVRFAAVVILSSGSVAGVAGAQARADMAISGLVPIPVGGLADNRNVGAGATAALRYIPVAGSRVAFRLELSGLPPSSHDNGVAPRVSNGSSAVAAFIGPEFDMPAVGGHFYATALAGGSKLWASSSAFALANPGGFATPVNTNRERQATNFAWNAGGGYVMPLSSNRSGVAADIGVRYYDLGPGTYTTLYSSGVTTTGHHRTTMVAPSVGLIWRL